MSPISSALADILFPPFCVACHAPDAWWCRSCQRKAERINGIICPKCLTIGEHVCDGNLPFHHVRAFGYYHDPILRSVVTALKFNGATAILPDLAAFLSGFNHPRMLDNQAVIIPMPLARKRLKERGFNQAALLAEQIRMVFEMTNELNTEVLQRSEMRQVQSSLDHEFTVRSQNIAGVFEVTDQVPQNILLIDDVATTGATAAEAARTLIEAGAEKVSLLTLAIGA